MFIHSSATVPLCFPLLVMLSLQMFQNCLVRCLTNTCWELLRPLSPHHLLSLSGAAPQPCYHALFSFPHGTYHHLTYFAHLLTYEHFSPGARALSGWQPFPQCLQTAPGLWEMLRRSFPRSGPAPQRCKDAGISGSMSQWLAMATHSQCWGHQSRRAPHIPEAFFLRDALKEESLQTKVGERHGVGKSFCGEKSCEPPNKTGRSSQHP